MLYENRDDGSDFKGRVKWKRFNPTDVELLPRHECRSRSIEIRPATPNRDDRLIKVAAGRVAVHNANRPVRERQFLRVTHEAVDCLSRWTSSKEHQCLMPKRDCRTALLVSIRQRRSRIVVRAAREAPESRKAEAALSTRPVPTSRAGANSYRRATTRGRRDGQGTEAGRELQRVAASARRSLRLLRP